MQKGHDDRRREEHEARAFFVSHIVSSGLGQLKHAKSAKAEYDKLTRTIEPKKTEEERERVAAFIAKAKRWRAEQEAAGILKPMRRRKNGVR